MSITRPDEHVPDIYKLQAMVERLTFALKRASTDLAALDPLGEKHSATIIDDALRFVDPQQNYDDYLKKAPVADALWWFIENVDETHPRRNEYFFLLRERVRNQD